MLQKWTPSIISIKNIYHGAQVIANYCGEDGMSAKEIIVCLLKFLGKLLKMAKEKRCFLSYESISALLCAADISIVELAATLLFHVTTPAISAATYGPHDMELICTIEVPKSITDIALAIFEGLGMMSVNYSVLDFLRGHYPSTLGPVDTAVVVSFPSSDQEDTKTKRTAKNDHCDVTIPLAASSDTMSLLHGAERSIGNMDMEVSMDKSIAMRVSKLSGASDSPHNVGILAYLWALESLQGTKQDRARIARLKLQCFYVLIHSRVPKTRFSPHVGAETNVLKDLLHLADVSSEHMEELNLAEPYELSKLALECITGILETSLRRRGQHFDKSEVMRQLGLTHSAVPAMSDAPMTSIVITSCSVVNLLLEGRFKAGEQLSHQSSAKATDIAPQVLGSYARIGMELFITGLTAMESSNKLDDVPVIAAIIGFLKASLPAVTSILQACNVFTKRHPDRCLKLDMWDVQVLNTVCKGLVTLSVCASHGDTSSIRESDGLGLLGSFLETFTTVWTEPVSRLDRSAKNILDCVLHILGNIIDSARRGGFQDNQDSGAQIIHQPAFATICTNIFSVPFKDNEYLWIELITLIKEAIVAEPTFLSLVLRCEYISNFAALLKPGADVSLLDSPAKLDALLVPVAKLAYSMCITAEGQAFVLDNRMPQFLVDACVHSSGLLPNSDGISGETLLECATYIGRMMRESEALQSSARSYLAQTLSHICKDAQRMWVDESSCVGIAVYDMKSVRMQVLQKLSNICSLIESLALWQSNKGNRGSIDIRDIFTDDIVEVFVRAFACTLPPIDELMAQLGVRSSAMMQHYGFHPTARAITSLLKVVTSLVPQIILPVIFRIIDETLTAVSSAKSALRMAAVALGSPLTPGAALGMEAFQYEAEANKLDAPLDRHQRQRRRSRGSSLGGEGTNVLILGILDSVPHLCSFDPALEDSKNCNAELRFLIWKLLTPMLMLEWHSSIVSLCLKPNPRTPTAISSNVLSGSKDVLRRLFAFHRSSLLEVCRFSASQWENKALNDCRNSRLGLLETFAHSDSSDDGKPILRIPTKYYLRVVSPNGALIREDCEFEYSRIVLLATVGTICTAYERSQTTAGVVRYRTEHGWLSEFRREQHRDPIVEILGVSYETVPDALAVDCKKAQTNSRDSKLRKVSESLTMRESVSHTMTRVNYALRQVGIHLSRTIMTESTEIRRGFSSSRAQVPSPSAPFVSTSLSKIFKGSLLHPFASLDDASQPNQLPIIKSGVLTLSIIGSNKAMTHSRSAPNSDDRDEDRSSRSHRSRSPASGISQTNLEGKTPAREGWAGKWDGSSSAGGTSKKFDGSGKPPRSIPRSTSKEHLLVGEEEIRVLDKELVPVSSAVMCMYQGAVVKHIIMPAMEDRAGNLNTYLLRTLLHFGGLDALLNAFVYVLSVLQEALSVYRPNHDSGIARINAEGEPVLGAAGSCALNAVPFFLQLFSKLVHKDACAKSPVTASMTGLVDDLGRFSATDMVHRLLMDMGTRFQSIFSNHDKVLLGFPADIQRDWLLLMGDIVHSLRHSQERSLADSSVPRLLAPAEIIPAEYQRYVSPDTQFRQSNRAIRSQATAREINAEDVHDQEHDRHSDLVGDTASQLSSSSSNTGHDMQHIASSLLDLLPSDTNIHPLSTIGSSLRVQTARGILEAPPSGGSSVTNDSPPDHSYPSSMGEVQRLEADIMLEAAGNPQLQADMSPASPISGSGAAPNVLEESTPILSLSDAQNALQMDASYVPYNQASVLDDNRIRRLLQDANAASVSNPFAGTSQQVAWTTTANPHVPARVLGSGVRPYVASSTRPRSAVTVNKRERDMLTATDPESAKIDEMQALARAMDAKVFENVLGIVGFKIGDGKYASSDQNVQPRSNESIPHVASFVVHFVELQQTSLRLFTLLDLLVDKIEFLWNGMDEPQRYDTLHLLLCLLKTSTVRSAVWSDFDEEFAARLLHALVDAIRRAIVERNQAIGSSTQSTSDAVPQWSSWLACAFLILADLFVSRNPQVDDIGLSLQMKNVSAATIAQALIAWNTTLLSSADKLLVFDICMEFLGSPAPSPPAIHVGVTCDVCKIGPIKGVRYQCTVREDFDLCSECYTSRTDTYDMRMIPNPINYGALAVNPACTDVYQGLFVLLPALLQEQTLASRFVSEGKLGLLLELPRYCLSAVTSATNAGPFSASLSLIVQRCVESNTELRQDMIRTIRTFWRNYKLGTATANNRNAPAPIMEGIPLSKFVADCALPLIRRSPEDFCAVVQSSLAFSRMSSSSDSAEIPSVSSELRVHLLNKDIQENLQTKDALALAHSSGGDPDARGLKALQILVEAIAKFYDRADSFQAQAGDEEVYNNLAMSPEFMLTALSDVFLSTRRAVMLIGKGAIDLPARWATETQRTLIDFLIERCLPTTPNVHGPRTLASAGRLLHVICNLRGAPREMILTSLLASLQRHSIVMTTAGSVVDNALASSVQKQIRILTRISKMISISIRVSKAPGASANTAGDVQVSADTVLFLLQRRVLDLLAQALEVIPLDRSDEGAAIDAILEPLELLLRPSLQQYLPNVESESKGNANGDASLGRPTAQYHTHAYDDGAEATFSANRAVIASANDASGREDVSISGVNAASIRAFAEAATEGLEIMEQEEVDEDDNDDEEEDEEDEDVEEEDLSINLDGDEEAYEVLESEDSRGTERVHFSIPNAAVPTLSASFGLDEDEAMDNTFRITRNSVGSTQAALQRLLDAPFVGDAELQRSLASVQNAVTPFNRNTAGTNANAATGFRMDDATSGNPFVTPPDQIRQDPLSMVLNGVLGSVLGAGADSPEANIFASLLRHLPGIHANPQPARVFSPTHARASGADSGLFSELIPQGLDQALLVQRPRWQDLHPLLTNAVLIGPERANAEAREMDREGMSLQMMHGMPHEPHGGIFLPSRPTTMDTSSHPDTVSQILMGTDASGAPSQRRAGSNAQSGTAIPLRANISEASETASAVQLLQALVGADITSTYDEERMESSLFHRCPHPGCDQEFSHISELRAHDNVCTHQRRESTVADTSMVQSAANSAGTEPHTSNRDQARSIDISRPLLPVSNVEPPSLEIVGHNLNAEQRDISQSSSTLEALSQAFDENLSIQAWANVRDRDTLSRERIAPMSAGIISSDGAVTAVLPPPPPVNAATTVTPPSIPQLDEPPSAIIPIADLAPTTYDGVQESAEEDTWDQASVGSDEADLAAAMAMSMQGPPEETLSANTAPLEAEPVSVPPAAQSGGRACPAGYDSEVFFSLPEDMQLEILAQHATNNADDQVRQLAAAAGFDFDTFMSLPEDIRQELLEQARREQSTTNAAANTPANPANAAEIDNASFLVSLPSDLRAEVLLTAEPEFLASLPPELRAEAQMHRERAANRWQARRADDQIANAQEEDVSSEDDEDDEDLSIGEQASGRNRRGASAATAGLSTSTARSDGLMVVTTSSASTMVPQQLLVVLCKIILATNVQVSFTLVRNLLQDLSESSSLRDTVLRMLTGVLSNDQTHVDACLGPQRLQLRQEIERVRLTTQAVAAAATPLAPYVKLSPLTGADRGPSRILINRILTAMSSLVAASENIRYDLLRNRLASGAVASEMEIVDLAGNGHDSIDDISKMTGTGLKLAQTGIERGDSSSLAMPPTEVSLTLPQRSHNIASSRRSLLESFLLQLENEDVSGDQSALLGLTHFISSVTSILEGLPSSDDNTRGKEHVNKLTKGQALVAIPRVEMSRSTLHSLCAILQNDLCVGPVFDNVRSAISNLARLDSNQGILVQLLVDVVEELCGLSRSRLLDLNEHLIAAEASYIAREGVAASSNKEQMAGGDQVARPVRMPTSALPVGKAGGRHHDQFLRAIHTLCAIVNKSRLGEIMSSEAVRHVWSVLEAVIAQLKHYLIDDDESKVAMPAKTQAQAALTSLISRLLPLIEAFFLVHASSIDLNAEPIPVENPASRPPGTPSSPESKKRAVPGDKHRRTVAYQRMNISLVPKDELFAEVGQPALQRSPSLHRAQSLPQQVSSANLSPLLARAYRLQSFVLNHKGILNLLIAAKPALLEQSFAVMMRVPQLRSALNFENKRKYFFAQLKALRSDETGRRTRNVIHLHLQRANVFEDSFHQLRVRSSVEMRGRMQINFQGEEGIDAGGVTREWYMVLSREIFNPNYALFTCAADGATFQPNEHSHVNNNHLDYFKFVGRVIGKAICDEQLMDAHFTRSFYKHMLGIPIDYIDIEAIEPDYYKSLKMILETPLDVLGLDLDFSAENTVFGKTEVIDLIPNGRNIPVTDANKFEYVQLISYHRTTHAIRLQIESFLDGFYELVPPALITIFSPTELELLICGLPDVDLDDLYANTDYTSFQPGDKCIQWFWEALRGFTREERAQFLQFVTGTSKVPLDGFANLQGMRGAQKFSIHRAFGDTALLPQAHTCFNQLDLPAYGSAQEMREKLLLAIKEGSEGFGFA